MNGESMKGKIMAKEKAEKAIEGPQPKIQEAGTVPVFEIPAGDPYIDCAIRCYLKASAKQIDPAARPLVLSADDPASVAVLKNYIQRAAGGGDAKRVDLARVAIAKFTQSK